VNQRAFVWDDKAQRLASTLFEANHRKHM